MLGHRVPALPPCELRLSGHMETLPPPPGPRPSAPAFPSLCPGCLTPWDPVHRPRICRVSEHFTGPHIPRSTAPGPRAGDGLLGPGHPGTCPPGVGPRPGRAGLGMGAKRLDSSDSKDNGATRPQAACRRSPLLGERTCPLNHSRGRLRADTFRGKPGGDSSGGGGLRLSWHREPLERHGPAPCLALHPPRPRPNPPQV